MASVAYPSAGTCYCTVYSSSSTHFQSFLSRLPSTSSSCNNITCSPTSPAVTTSRRKRRILMAISDKSTGAALSPSTILLPRFRNADTSFLSLPASSSFSSIRWVSTSSAAAAAASKGTNANPNSDSKRNGSQVEGKKEEEVEVVEEDLPWIQDKAMDLVEFTGSVTQAIPGPRVGKSSLPWMLAIPLAYVGITFVMALVKTVRKFSSPKEIRRKLINKNASLCKSVDDLLEKRRDGIQQSALKGLMQKTGFSMEEILRKYIRYSLNEKPFNPDLVANLIQLRKASLLEDSQVAEILNEISRRIVKDKGPVVMDAAGYSEKGFKRKLAVQALFGKVYYLSELPEFCSRDSSLIVKEIFGATDEDAEKLRLHTLSEYGDVDSLEKMVDDSDSEGTSDV